MDLSSRSIGTPEPIQAPSLKDDRSIESYADIRANKKQRIITGWQNKFLGTQRIIRNLIQILILYKSLPKSIRVFKAVRKLKTQIAGKRSISKMVEVDQKYFWRLHVPGWGTALYKEFIKSELNRIEKLDQPAYRLANAFVAITKKCPLRCEHCFEWDNLNQAEKLSVSDIEKIIIHLQEIGTGTIDITGGEPMLRVKEILPIIEAYHDKSAFFMLTSGFNFTADNARKLKAAGLTGVMVSMDHYEPALHDKFRGMEGSFRQVLHAVKHSIENNMVTVLSVCLTRETANRDFLMKYLALAKDLGVAFVQILEPKPIGHYTGKDVLLKPDQLKLVEEFYLQMNYDNQFKDFPIVIYHGYYQRKVGCLSAGSRSVYIDTNGDILSCPFCHRKAGSALEKGYAQVIDEMEVQGCMPFKLRI